jgi:hypothetical protein
MSLFAARHFAKNRNKSPPPSASSARGVRLPPSWHGCRPLGSLARDQQAPQLARGSFSFSVTGGEGPAASAAPPPSPRDSLSTCGDSPILLTVVGQREGVTHGGGRRYADVCGDVVATATRMVVIRQVRAPGARQVGVRTSCKAVMYIEPKH